MSFQRGMGEVISGILGGIILSAVLAAFAKDGLIPWYVVFGFAVAGLIGSLALMFSFATAGIIFTIGWIIGAILLKDLLGPVDFMVYIIAPVAALVIRLVAYIRNSVS